MKILIVTTPNGEQPSLFPPIGALSIMNYARKRTGHDYQFYNIDYFRPQFDLIINTIESCKPDILGISAVVSTSYAFTQKLSFAIKKRLPDTLIVVGGNLCASAEILLKRTGVDLCVLGEGEIVFYNIVKQAEMSLDPSSFVGIPGLALLDDNRELVNTGFEEPMPAAEIWDINWDDLVKDKTFDYYFPLTKGLENNPHYKRRYAISHINYQYVLNNEEARQGFLTIARGCVNRCTFCHRWTKGMRHIPVDEVIKRLDHLYDKYNVRYFNMVTESFGADGKWLDEFLKKLKERKIIWGAGGVRASVVNPELINKMKETGCTSLIYGNETGSSKMLEIMEKRVSLDDNYNAAKWTVEANLGNIVQLVIGMPGESDETIRETIEYCKYATSISPDQDPRQISINYAQALPGTPLYEYARIHGLLGENGIESEEKYLVKISDCGAADPLTFVNFTGLPRLTVLSWNMLIRIEVRFNYYLKFGATHYYKLLNPEHEQKQIGLSHFSKLLLKRNMSELFACYPQFFYMMRALVPLVTFLQMTSKYGIATGYNLLIDYIRNRIININAQAYPSISLRKIVAEDKTNMNINDDPNMASLRSGR